ncbi:rRNA maturation RNase YbeY [Candidatus Poribacteria bacterium]|nr:rRNA maturation RNase YbeY [Candidatus Poribacteria bacterium]
MIDSSPDLEVGDDIVDTVRKAAEVTLSSENVKDFELSILLTDDEEIQRLNRIYRDVDRPTDVLAFAMREGEDGQLNQNILGDVVISLPTTRHQAESYGHSFDMELSLLVSHGVLHLIGYEHDRQDNMEIMEQRQRKVLCLLGYDLSDTGNFLETPNETGESR